MPTFAPRIGGMNLPVADLDAMTAFYRDVFGLTPLHQEEGLAVYRFGDTNVALRHDPGHSGPADDVLALARRGLGQLSIPVDDVDAAAAELAGLGVRVLTGPADLPWGIRSLTFADPSGYTWELAQDLG